MAPPSKRRGGYLDLDSDREKVSLRFPLELNDWLNGLLSAGRRRHGRKIPKEVWVQAAVELLRAQPVQWEDIADEKALRAQIREIARRERE